MLTKQKNRSTVSSAYQLIKLAWNHSQTGPESLDPTVIEKLQTQAQVAEKIIMAVLQSDAAKNQQVRQEEVNFIIEQLQQQFENPQSFTLSLQQQGLTVTQLELAIYQDLLCEKTVAAQSQDYRAASEQEALDYYQKNRAQFRHSERRNVSHILITINDLYRENSKEQARARLTQLRTLLLNDISSFPALALANSECPTALNNGLIGRVTRGQLYPQLDDVLFFMQAGTISPIIESEIGLHLLLCHEILPAGEQPEADAIKAITKQINQHRQKKCEKQWITSLLANS
ncbi:MAG: peptidyl-prolyl cis-trans isomerase C [Psychromonas sp.]|jgi:peptidyl-prolyl cis-trans isomerase C|uniref:peptidylprolyl isomerase n=1 Tax=Psychromonas sp. TaxID=1884585 RepID=UPI0039E6456F